MKKLGKWWERQRCRCKSCGEHFELEEDDKPIRGDFNHRMGDRLPPYFYNVECPSCGMWCAVTKPYDA